MKVKISRLDKKLPLPQYETEGATAIDLYARLDYTVEPQSLGFIPCNVIIEVPSGYMLVVVPRSGTPKKLGLSIPHGIGIIDQDYCGPKDEIKIQVYNFTNIAVHIQRGRRLAQAAFVRVDKVQWNEVENIKQNSRGAFGSTDK